MKKKTAADPALFYLCRVELRYCVWVLSDSPEKAKRIALKKAKQILDAQGAINPDTRRAWTRAAIEEYFGANVYTLPLNEASKDDF